ncbi:cache domain-containing sensor histidine kinase [Cohnella silvisoli]|uniref:Sensor histidine kinase n=1 Tax=Cohnella silvisoli TaxID=2873699 RepID=A0ABV1KVW2_9BACL|nr:sensor histidine kinase [Cohnella silvisoli]MCD9023645.1 sensor histidine kinase [Cohnella silvisoli]
MTTKGIRRFAFRDWGMGKKLTVLYTLMILLPVIVVTLLGFQRYYDNLKGKMGDLSLQLLDQVGRNIDNYLQEIDRISLTFYLNEDDLKVIADGGKETSPTLDYEKKISINRTMNSIMRASLKDIMGAYLFQDGKVFAQYGSGFYVDYSNSTKEAWFADALKGDGKGILIPTHRIDVPGEHEKYALSFARSLINITNHKSFGVLMMDIGMDTIADIMNPIGNNNGEVLFIVDGNGHIIYHPDQKLWTHKFDIPLPKSRDTFFIDIDGKQTMVNYVTASRYGWKIVGTMPVKELTKDLSLLRSLLWTLAGGTLLVSIAIAALLTSHMIKPLKKIRILMRRVEEGDYKVRYRSPSNDEIGQVGQSFNVMVQRINELVTNVLTINILKKEADFKALQSQINPHFLYNTLESINMKAEFNGDYEVADMISLLGKLFRMSVNQSSELIPFSQELEFIQVYVNLQKLRYPNMTVEIDIPEEILQSWTLPWIIQPLVENAIIHGLAPNKGAGMIRIIGSRDEDRTFITVIDDGVGIEADRLKQIRSQLIVEMSVLTSHIGLKNVHDRIQLQFGRDCGLSIDSERGEGTRVIVSVSNREWREIRDANAYDRG